MSLDERVRESEEESQAHTAARRAVPWVVLGFVALVLLELFAHPLLALSVFSLKFALNDFLTAAWLLRRDPVRSRGRTGAVLYTAAGFWKACVVNYGLFTAAIGYTLLTGRPAWPQPAPGVPAPNFAADGLTVWAGPAILGYVTTSVLGLTAWRMADARHQMLWLGPAADHARRNGLWPPPDVGPNWLRFGPALVAAGLPAACGLVGALAIVAFPAPAAVNPGVWKLDVPLHFLFGLMLILPPIGISGTIQERGNRYLLAGTPAECWGEAEESAPIATRGL
jgi:hypothetical protein